MSDKPETKTTNPPYIAAHIWKEFFSKMQMVNQPSDLTISTLEGYGLGKGQEAALLSGLKFLGLVHSDGKTVDQFKGIQVQGVAFKENLSKLLTKAYSDLFEKHPLSHATYESLKNYFSQKYSTASAGKMAKSFAALCQLAGMDSPAFQKMRSLPGAPPARAERGSGAKREPAGSGSTERKQPRGEEHRNGTKDDLLKEFIKTNPMPTGVQWNAETLRAFFKEYRQTLRMLGGQQQDLQSEDDE